MRTTGAFLTIPRVISLERETGQSLYASFKKIWMCDLDGKSEIAAGGGSGTWIDEATLEQISPVKKVAMHSSKTGHANKHEILLSNDRQNWIKMLPVDGKGLSTHIETEFPPTQARYVRLRGLKPDGPNQSGSRMAVAELEVYQ